MAKAGLRDPEVLTFPRWSAHWGGGGWEHWGLAHDPAAPPLPLLTQILHPQSPLLSLPGHSTEYQLSLLQDFSEPLLSHKLMEGLVFPNCLDWQRLRSASDLEAWDSWDPNLGKAASCVDFAEGMAWILSFSLSPLPHPSPTQPPQSTLSSKVWDMDR